MNKFIPWSPVFALFFVGLSAAAKQVTGAVGDTLKLPCTYSVRKGKTTVCWGRGSCRVLWCSNVILQTEGSRVTQRKSTRYQLLGDITQGDVSLTITEVTEEDEGTYCCLVEIQGWFNDYHKNEIEVRIREGRITYKKVYSTLATVRPEVGTTPSASTTADTRKNSTGDPGQTNYSSVGNTIRGIIVFLFPALTLLVYKCCSLQSQ